MIFFGKPVSTFPDHALDVVIEMKLVRMGAQPDRVELLFPLVVQPGFNHVAGEHIAAQQAGVIASERKAGIMPRRGSAVRRCSSGQARAVGHSPPRRRTGWSRPSTDSDERAFPRRCPRTAVWA